MSDFGVKASTNEAQTQNNSKHIIFQRLISLLQDMGQNQSGGIGISSISNLNITKVTADYSVDVGDAIIYCNSSTKIITLPYAADGGRCLFFATQPTGTIQIQTQSGDTIGLTSNTFPFSGGYFGQGKFLILMSNGITDWQIVSYGDPNGVVTLAGDVSGVSNANLVNTINGANITPVNNALSPYTVLTTDMILNVDCSGGAVTINLPPATRHQVFFIEKIDAFPAPFIVTLSPNGGDTINGSTTIAPGGYAILVSDGVSNWYVLIGNMNGTATPIGSAGNNLDGNYPNPSVSGLSKMITKYQPSGTRSVSQGDFLWIASGGSVTFNLPPANSGSFKNCFAFKALAACNFALNANGGDTIEGLSTLAGGPGDSFIIQSDGISAWNIIASSASYSPQTTVNGSVSGSIVWTQPQQGASSKKVLIQFNAFNDAGTTVTFSTAFSSTPIISSNSSGLVVTVTTTTATIPVSTGVSGWVILEGF